MAALGTGQWSVLHDEGSAPRWTLFRVVNFNTGDTLDVSSRFAGTVEVATLVSSQSTTPGTVTSTTAAVLTLTQATSTSASALLLVRGQAST